MKTIFENVWKKIMQILHECDAVEKLICSKLQHGIVNVKTRDIRSACFWKHLFFFFFKYRPVMTKKHINLE